MPTIREIRDIGFTIGSPMTIGLKDVDGDIATLLTDTLVANGSDERITEFYDAPTETVSQDKELTYKKRWMYFYLSSILSPYVLKGWGELGNRVGNVRGGGTVRFQNNGPFQNPTWSADTE